MHITTLIPAYKPQFLKELLTSLRVQTVPSRRILISDDSPDGSFSQLLQSAEMQALTRGLPLEIHPGPRAGAYENFKHLVRLWGRSSELVHLYLDDDVLFPDFYERHVSAHLSGTWSCSISGRWSADEQGQPVAGQPLPRAVKDVRERMVSLDAGVLFMTTVAECKNWFGEFSNCVIRADSAELLFKPELGGISYAGLWDLGFFLAASLRAPVAYIQDRLGYFRTGGGSNSSQFFGKFMKAAHLGYVALAIGGQRIGQLQPQQALACYRLLAPAMLQRYGSQADMLPFIHTLNRMAQGEEQAVDDFARQWADYLQAQGF